MDDEWDLHAVVRSCTTNSTDAATPTSGTNTTVAVDDYDDEFYNMETVLASRNDINPYSGENPSEGLEQVYKEGCSQQQPTTTTTTTVSVDADVGGFFDEQEQLSVFDASDHSLSIESPSKKSLAVDSKHRRKTVSSPEFASVRRKNVNSPEKCELAGICKLSPENSWRWICDRV